jgi:hypothetical protein
MYNYSVLELYLILSGLSWQWSYGSWIHNYLCNQFPFTTKIVSLNSAHGEVYVIKFVSNLQQVCGFLRVLVFLHQWNWLPRYNRNIDGVALNTLTLILSFSALISVILCYVIFF